MSFTLNRGFIIVGLNKIKVCPAMNSQNSHKHISQIITLFVCEIVYNLSCLQDKIRQIFR